MSKFFGFVFAGGVATLLNFTVFVLLLWIGVGPYVSSATGYLSGIALSYLINTRMVFATRTRPSVFAYYFIYFLALMLQLCLLYALLLFGVNPLAANSIAIAIVVVVNYLVMKRFLFRQGLH